MNKHQWQTLGLGALAGLRSMTAPALLAHNLSKYHVPALAHSPLGLLQKPWVATGLRVLAASEMASDKLPHMPDRIVPVSLVGRALAGALTGAVLYKANHARPLAGALLGGAAALAATFGSFWLRKRASAASKLPNAVLGGLEDALVLASGLALSKGTNAGAPAGRAL